MKNYAHLTIKVLFILPLIGEISTEVIRVNKTNLRNKLPNVATIQNVAKGPEQRAGLISQNPFIFGTFVRM